MGACPFISEVSSSNVVSVTLLFIFFQSISENRDSIDFLVLLLVNPTSTVAKKQVFLENLNASTLPWLLSSSRPPRFLVSERGLFSWIVHTGSGGMEFQVTLCSAASRFLSQLTS